MEERPWQGWLLSLLVGAALTVLAMGWLGRGQPSTATAPAVESTVRERNSIGFSFSLRFEVLLPDRGGEDGA